MKRPEPSDLLMDFRTIRDNKPADDEPDSMKQLRKVLDKSPAKMMQEMFALEREYEKRLAAWEARQQKLSETKNKTPVSISPQSQSEGGDDKAIALAKALLVQLKKERDA